MRAAALADALEDFAPRRRGASFVMPFAVADAPEETSLLLVDASDPPSPSDAEAEALEALAERLRHEHDAELAAERERHAAELAALNERIGELVGTTLVAEMETARDSVVSLVTSVVARILAPVLSSDVQGRSLIALAEVVRDAIDDYKEAADQGLIKKQPDETGYPPTLQILVQGVENKRDPKKGKVYFLRRIPRDPFATDAALANEETWGKRSYNSSFEEPEAGDDIYDVYSLSPQIGINQRPYREW